jgi:hypothetical protein
MYSMFDLKQDYILFKKKIEINFLCWNFAMFGAAKKWH